MPHIDIRLAYEPMLNDGDRHAYPDDVTTVADAYRHDAAELGPIEAMAAAETITVHVFDEAADHSVHDAGIAAWLAEQPGPVDAEALRRHLIAAGWVPPLVDAETEVIVRDDI